MLGNAITSEGPRPTGSKPVPSAASILIVCLYIEWLNDTSQ